MLAKAVVAHQIPGRARLLIPDKRADAEYFGRVFDEFSRDENVKKLKVNPETGSLVLEFSGDLRDIVQRADAHELFSVDTTETAQRTPASFTRNANKNPINLVSGREIDPMFMMGTALGVAGLFQFVRGHILMPAIPLFRYAAQAFCQSGKHAGEKIDGS